MEACNAYYYATRDPLGRDGDFTTAPEISQMFGELIGAALADCWNRAGAPIGGGVGVDLNYARRIAVAESCERGFLTSITERSKWRLDSHPTSCGFAAGFDNESTRLRSLCEAIERWVWSQWIDFKCFVPPVAEPELSKLGRHYRELFDEVRYFEKIIQTSYYPTKMKACITLGVKNDGLFPGSRVCPVDDDGWTHALTEAKRHLSISQKSRPVSDQDEIYDRIFHFAANGRDGLAQIPTQESNWPEMKLSFQSGTEVGGIFYWRTLIDNYIPWEQGDRSRFVY